MASDSMGHGSGRKEGQAKGGFSLPRVHVHLAISHRVFSTSL